MRLFTEYSIDALDVDMSEAMLSICREANPASDFQETPFYVRQTIRMIEFLAGKRHFRNFRTYTLEGGLATLVRENRFCLVASTHRAYRNIVLQLFNVLK